MNHSQEVGTLTVCALADAKHLFEKELREFGLHDLRDGVGINYYDLAGQHVLVKRRTALKARDGSFWPFETKLIPYGLWRLKHARAEGRLYLVEGESDCWAMWHHKLPCLGLPGAGAARALETEHLLDITQVFILKEPDQGGLTFVAGIKRRLQELGFGGRLQAFSLLDGIKDAADLHCLHPFDFVQMLERSMANCGVTAAACSVAAAEKPTKQAASSTLATKQAASSTSTTEQSRIIRLSAVRGERVSWLCPGRIPLGKLTILDGDPGLGKSSLMLDLAARLSRGSPLPGDDRDGGLEPKGVALLSAEDGLQDTLYPRLEAAGADMRQIVNLSCIDRGSESRPVELPQDLAFLEEAIFEADAKLVVIDPLMAFLGGEYSANSDQHVRRALHPLALLAERLRVAIVIVRHLNKNEKVKQALYRGGGSIGIVGAARSALLVAADPNAADRRILAVVKSNLAKRAESLSFSVVAADNGASRILWHGVSDVQAESLLTSAEPEEPLALNEAIEFLQVLLHDEPVPANEVHRQALLNGVAVSALRRAKHKLGVCSLRRGFGDDGEWCWSLPKAGEEERAAS